MVKLYWVEVFLDGAVSRGGHNKPKPNTEPELTGTETEYTETELTEEYFGA